MKLGELVDKFNEQIAINATEIIVLPSLPLKAQALYVVCKSLFSAAIDLRKDRAEDFLRTIGENAEKFTDEVLENEQVQDAFIHCFEEFIRERNEGKRKAIKRIFLGFVASNDKASFQIEKMTAILKLLSLEDLKILQIWADGTIVEWHKKQIVGSFKNVNDRGLAQVLEEALNRGLNVDQIGRLILNNKKGLKEFISKEYTFEKLSYLVSVGLLTEVMGGLLNPSSGSFKISEFGGEFIKYINYGE